MGHTAKADLDEGPCFAEGSVRETGEARNHPGNDAKFLFGSGEGYYKTTMPEGYGTLIQADGLFQASHHALNLRPAPITMGGKLNILIAEADEIRHPVRTLACDNRGIDIPPQSSVTVTATCTAPFDLDIIKVSSHAHQHLTLFEVRFFDGENADDDGTAPSSWSSTSRCTSRPARVSRTPVASPTRRMRHSPTERAKTARCAQPSIRMHTRPTGLSRFRRRSAPWRGTASYAPSWAVMIAAVKRASATSSTLPTSPARSDDELVVAADGTQVTVPLE
jgi:hypothetical protein